MKYFFRSLFLLIIIVFFGCKNDNDKLRIGIIRNSLDHLPLEFAFEIEALDKENYQIKRFSTSKSITNALKKRNIDVGIMPFVDYCVTYPENDSKIISFLQREGFGIISTKKVDSFSEIEVKTMSVHKALQTKIYAKLLLSEFDKKTELKEFSSLNKLIEDLENKKIETAFLKTPEIFKIKGDFTNYFPLKSLFSYYPVSDIVATNLALKSKLTEIKLFINGLKNSCKTLNENPKVAYEVVYEFYQLPISLSRNTLHHTKYRMGLQSQDQQFEDKIIDILKQDGNISTDINLKYRYFEIE
ncbi:MAG: hypothetical protein K8S23_16020 [Candidatus Cloacimonetes bacterium]|nr:hypothetical protein [Candidatus Cloacimonadota bacterium]